MVNPGFYSGQYGGYGVAVAQELVELLVWVRLPVVTPKYIFMIENKYISTWSSFISAFLLIKLNFSGPGGLSDPR